MPERPTDTDRPRRCTHASLASDASLRGRGLDRSTGISKNSEDFSESKLSLVSQLKLENDRAK